MFFRLQLYCSSLFCFYRGCFISGKICVYDLIICIHFTGNFFPTINSRNLNISPAFCGNFSIGYGCQLWITAFPLNLLWIYFFSMIVNCQLFGFSYLHRIRFLLKMKTFCCRCCRN